MDCFPTIVRLLNSVVYYISYLILRENGTINRRLLSFIEFLLSFLPTHPYGVVSSDQILHPPRGVWFRTYHPLSPASTDGSLPVIVYFHGGGFALFSPKFKLFDDFCRRLAGELPAVVVSVNYRLSPEHRYPCQYDDAFDVLRHIDGDENGIDRGDLGRCFLAGDSAGGNLAHHIAVRVSCFEFKKIRVRGLVAIQPFFGGEERTKSDISFGKDPSAALSLRSTDIFWNAFLPVGSDRNHPAAHVFGPGLVDLAGVEYPPTVLFVGGRDLLQDWQRKYRDWLIGSGKQVRMVEYPDMSHFFYVFGGLRESAMLVDEIRSFIYTI